MQLAWPFNLVFPQELFTSLNKCLAVLVLLRHRLQCCATITVHVVYGADAHSQDGTTMVREHRHLLGLLSELLHDLYDIAVGFVSAPQR